MTEEDKSLTPELVFMKFVWRGIAAHCGTYAQYTGWTVTGVAAIAGLLISNLDSVGAIVSPTGLRWALISFAFSLLSGVLSRGMSMGVSGSLDVLSKMEEVLNSPDGQRVVGAITTGPKKLLADVSVPFLWPLSSVLRYLLLREADNPLATEKWYIRMFCIQLYALWCHELLAVIGIIVIAVSIRG